MRKCCDGVREPSELCLALRECFRSYLIASAGGSDTRDIARRYLPRVVSGLTFREIATLHLNRGLLSVFAQTHGAMLAADAHRRVRPDANGGSIQTHEWPRDVIKEIYQ